MGKRCAEMCMLYSKFGTGSIIYSRPTYVILLFGDYFLHYSLDDPDTITHNIYL